ncbi:MAG: hypothetical protein LC791_10865, partial [Acidobacteria bacterium]|nr:hypothetical protein [Acidobacteriota bacterium]
PNAARTEQARSELKRRAPSIKVPPKKRPNAERPAAVRYPGCSVRHSVGGVPQLSYRALEDRTRATRPAS